MKFCIDPGHGKGNNRPGLYDPGASGNGIEEAAYALMLGLLVKAELVRRGHSVVMTRTDHDTPAPLGSRPALGSGCALYLSIHCNAAESSAARGSEVLSTNAPAMAGRLSKAVSAALGIPDRGAKPDERGLAVLRGARCPAMLLEVGFLSNPADAGAMTDQSKRGALVSAICDVAAV